MQSVSSRALPPVIMGSRDEGGKVTKAVCVRPIVLPQRQQVHSDEAAV